MNDHLSRMKAFTIVLFAAVVVTLIIAGCTSNQQSNPAPGNTINPTYTNQNSPQGTVTIPTTIPISTGTSQPAVTIPVTGGTVLPTPTVSYYASPAPTPAYIGVPSPLALQNTWYLQSILLKGAGAPLDVSQVRVTATFDSQGQVTGNSGCNNYDGPYVVTGRSTSSGNGISIGPLSTTLMFCPDSSDTETMYMQILGSAVSYALFPGQTMSITDNPGNSLVFSTSTYLPQT
jgi:heat shock protein HslJ